MAHLESLSSRLKFKRSHIYHLTQAYRQAPQCSLSAKTQPTCEDPVSLFGSPPSLYFFSALISLKVTLMVIFFVSETMYLQAIEAGQRLIRVWRELGATSLQVLLSVRLHIDRFPALELRSG